ncbi:MAG: DUF4129 domain-containing protein [Acidimicrobiales bacterium]
MGRWLAIPAAIVLVILVALGAQSQTGEEFQQQQRQQSSEANDSQGSSGSESGESSGGGGDGKGGSSGQPGDGREIRYRYDENSGSGGQPLEPPTRISIETDNGRIAFEPAGVVDNQGVTWDIEEPLPGRLVGFRLVDGEFFIVQRGLEVPGDQLISWDGDTIVLSEVGGGITEIRRDDNAVSGSYTAPGGTPQSFAQAGDTPVVANPALQAEPEDVGPIFGIDPSEPFDPPFAKSWPWGWIGLGTALTMFFVGMWLIFKDGIGLATVNFSVPQHTKVVRGDAPADEADLFERLRQNPDADAVIRELYDRATSGEWLIPVRAHQETPLEFFARVRDAIPADAASELSQLSDLYSAVRFAPRTADLADRDRAIELAQRMLFFMQQPQRLVGV